MPKNQIPGVVATDARINCSISKKVPFYDVDAYQIVWHGRYPKYFEEARCKLLEKIEYSYAEMDASGYVFPVIDLQIRFIRPLVYKQEVRITASLKEWQNKLVVEYLITDQLSGDRLTRGSTTQAAIKMPERITQYQSPAELLGKVQAMLQNA